MRLAPSGACAHDLDRRRRLVAGVRARPARGDRRACFGPERRDRLACAINRRLTAKERLSEKWTDEQRVDNCKVPIDKRGQAAARHLPKRSGRVIRSWTPGVVDLEFLQL